PHVAEVASGADLGRLRARARRPRTARRRLGARNRRADRTERGGVRRTATTDRQCRRADAPAPGDQCRRCRRGRHRDDAASLGWAAMAPRKPVYPAVLRAALERVGPSVTGEIDEELPRPDLSAAVRLSARTLEQIAPGSSVEVRVPP